MKLARGTESELKYGLSCDEYQVLVRAYRGLELRIEQHTNYYFDDVHLNLRKRRIGLRIRLTGTRAVVTLKYPKMGESEVLRALKVRQEYESVISKKTASEIIKGKKDILSLRVLPIKRLSRVYPLRQLCRLQALGSIETRRILLPLNKNFVMELDRSRMFGQYFYELEVETPRPEKADKAIHNLFWKFDVHYQPRRRSKLARFIDEWRRRQGRSG